MNKGIISVVISAVLLGVIPVIQKQLLVTGLSNYTMFLYTDIVILLFNFGISRIKRHSLRIKPCQILQCMAIALMGQLLTGIFLSISYMHTSVAVSTMVNFLYPSIVCVVVGIFIKKRLSKLQISAIICSIVGMAALMGIKGTVSPVGAGMALLSAFTYSAYLILGDMGCAKDLPVDVKMVYIGPTAMTGYIILCLLSGNPLVPQMSAENWLLMLGGSGFFSALSAFLILYGVKILGATTASFISILEPITSVAVGTIWFGDAIGSGTIIGGLLLLSSILLITWNDKREEEGQVGTAAVQECRK